MLGDLRGRQVVAIASFDSFIKTANIMLDACRGAGASTTLVVAELPGRRPTAEQIEKAGVRTPPVFVPLHEVAKHPLVANADAVLLLLEGRSTRRLMRLLYARRQRPAIVSAFPGLIFRSHISSFIDRAPADVLCLNSETDRAIYTAVGNALGLRANNALVTGLPLLWDMPQIASKLDGAVVFFEQPAIPDNEQQREHLADSLVAFAAANPDVPVILKGRNRAGEPTLHRSRGPLENLIAKKQNVPANLTISYASTVDILRETRVAVTISSTAALEALAQGIPTRIITDLGITEQLGNHFFHGSDLFSTFENLLDSRPRLANDWLEMTAKRTEGKSRFIAALSQSITADRYSGPDNHAKEIYLRTGKMRVTPASFTQRIRAYLSRLKF